MENAWSHSWREVEELIIEMLLLYFERSEWWRFRHLTRMLVGWVLGEKFQTYPGQNQDSAYQLTFQQLEKVWEFLH